jgi:hypothetical protein
MRPRRSAGYEGLLEQGHVLAGLLLDRSKKRCRQRAAKILGDLVAELRLLAGQLADGEFEIARHQHLHAVAIKADELAQEVNRHKALPVLSFLFENDLGQHRTRNVIPALGVEDHKIIAFLDHGGEVLERDISARAGIVEPPVRVFFDRDGFIFLGHDRSPLHGTHWRT